MATHTGRCHCAPLRPVEPRRAYGTPDHTRRPSRGSSTQRVIEYVGELISSGRLRPGNRLPSERELTVAIGVSRPTVRAGLRALAAMGVVQSRHGSGTYIPDGPPALGAGPLSFMMALHGFTPEDVFEARRILEIGRRPWPASARHPSTSPPSPRKSPGCSPR